MARDENPPDATSTEASRGKEPQWGSMQVTTGAPQGHHRGTTGHHRGTTGHHRGTSQGHYRGITQGHNARAHRGTSLGSMQGGCKRWGCRPVVGMQGAPGCLARHSN